MKILKIYKLFIIISLFINIISCSQNSKEPQVRFVDLHGNPRKIRLNTPTENAIALTKQGRMTEEKIVEEKNYKKQESEKQKPLSYNKYANEEALTKPEGPKGSSNELIYTMNLPTEENNQKNTAKTEEKTFEITKKPQKQTKSRKSQRKSQRGARIISETKIPADESSSYKKQKLRKGMYVQAGSFKTMKHARQHLNKVKSLTNNPKNVNIQSAKVRNKNYYRVVIGPITKKKTAKLIIKDLKKKGQNSIIIKIR